MNYNVHFSAPNLQQTITPAMLNVQMFVEELVSGNWVLVNHTLVAGTTIRLRIEYDRGAAFVGRCLAILPRETTKITCTYGYATYVR